MSGPFKVSLIAGAVGGLVLALINVVLGGRSVGGFLGVFLIAFAIILLVTFVIARVVMGRRSNEEEYEYEDD